ncbi:MAG: hypothetical protein HQK53_07590, partial [Oligoflexia bacterium]|nr:hypothetical protein [Oligoflexia bacterium]
MEIKRGRQPLDTSFLLVLPLLLLMLLLMVETLFADVFTPPLPQQGVVTPDMDSFFDPNIDYTRFYGRISDRDTKGKIIKIRIENNNIKFFRAGDLVEFARASIPNSFCKGYV